MKSPRTLPVSVASVLASMLMFAVAPSALAAGNGPRSPGIIGEAERWITAATAGPTAASDPTTHGASTQTSRTAERDAPQAAEPPSFMELVPNVSLVARDWRGSVKLLGERTMLVDELRPTASNRMVVARLATSGRFKTFGQIGAGEWRIDTAMFPNARAYSEVAGQVGGGFELTLSSRLRVAGEAQYTMLYRDLTYSPDEIAPRMISFVVAFAGRF
jgi:hypothetical protein